MFFFKLQLSLLFAWRSHLTSHQGNSAFPGPWLPTHSHKNTFLLFQSMMLPNSVGQAPACNLSFPHCLLYQKCVCLLNFSAVHTGQYLCYWTLATNTERPSNFLRRRTKPRQTAPISTPFDRCLPMPYFLFTSSPAWVSVQPRCAWPALTKQNQWLPCLGCSTYSRFS